MGNFFRLFFLLLFFAPLALASQLIINQAGYPTNLPKFFYSETEADSFYVVDASSGVIYFRSKMVLSVINDPAAGMTLYKGDFSGLNREGDYLIRTSNGDSSYSFSISDSIYDEVYKKSLKGFYFQRCGSQLHADHAGDYFHPACHTTDAFFHTSTNKSGFSFNTGGWHDAGDYGKYVVNAGITAGTLLMAYEEFPEKFSSDNLNIPESGNSIPDLLDEIIYELKWMLKMQDTLSGGVYHKLTKPMFESFIMPNQDSGTRYIYQISSTATGNFAAVMSRASRILANFDEQLSDQCLNAAEKAWDFLVNNGAIVPPGGFKNPTGTDTGEYGDNNDTDERLWAAAELFETTGGEEYKNYYEILYSNREIFLSTMSWQNVRSLSHLTYLLAKQPSTDDQIKNDLKNRLISYCGSLLQRINSNGFGISINPGEYVWGSNSIVLNNAVLLILGFKLTDNLDYQTGALHQLNYVLGANPHSLSFVTGIGYSSVMNPHHRPSGADGIAEPVPGLLAGGANQFLNDPVLQQNFSSSTPPALCYIDLEGSYASNEIAINWNAPLVFAAGFFSSLIESDIKQEGSNIFNDDFKLRQNYPNPFNPRTTIEFYIPKNAPVELRIYDLLGREVSLLINEEKEQGIHEIEFDAGNLTSGIYLYRLTSGNYAAGKKMIYLK